MLSQSQFFRLNSIALPSGFSDEVFLEENDKIGLSGFGYQIGSNLFGQCNCFIRTQPPTIYSSISGFPSVLSYCDMSPEKGFDPIDSRFIRHRDCDIDDEPRRLVWIGFSSISAVFGILRFIAMDNDRSLAIDKSC